MVSRVHCVSESPSTSPREPEQAGLSERLSSVTHWSLLEPGSLSGMSGMELEPHESLSHLARVLAALAQTTYTANR